MCYHREANPVARSSRESGHQADRESVRYKLANMVTNCRLVLGNSGVLRSFPGALVQEVMNSKCVHRYMASSFHSIFYAIRQVKRIVQKLSSFTLISREETIPKRIVISQYAVDKDSNCNLFN